MMQTKTTGLVFDHRKNSKRLREKTNTVSTIGNILTKALRIFKLLKNVKIFNCVQNVRSKHIIIFIIWFKRNLKSRKSGLHFIFHHVYIRRFLILKSFIFCYVNV